MTYQIVFKQSVKKDIRGLPQAVLARIQDVLRSLQEDPFPSGCAKLQGYDDSYRLRIGNYRIIYEVAVQIKILTIIKIGHRKDVYRL